MFMNKILLSLFVIHLSCSQPIDLCSNGCQLLYNVNFLECDSNEAFVPNSYMKSTNDMDINDLIENHFYICFNRNYQRIDSISNENNGDTANALTQNGSSVFTLDSPVLIWQAIIISIVVPLFAVLIFKAVLILCNKCCELSQFQNNDKCCCCLYLCSAEYRQKRRNRRFHNEIYNNPNVNAHELDIQHQNQNNVNNGKKWWKFNRKNKNNGNKKDDLQQNVNAEPIIGQNVGNRLQLNGEVGLVLDNDNHGEDIAKGMNDNEYEHLPLNEKNMKGDKNVLEEVSVGHDEVEKYLQAPGGNTQDIELSFSSQGLRQISYRDVV